MSASSSTTLTFQWLKNGSVISGATSSSYTISTVHTTDAGNYSVNVINAYGTTASSSATLTVTAPPAITNQPQSVELSIGQTAVFSVGAGGTLPLTYQWKLGNANISGATNSSLTLTNVQSSQAGNYTVTVATRAGSTTSSVASLTVNNTPAIISQPQNQTVVQGQNVTFTLVMGGATPMNVFWYFNGSQVASTLFGGSICTVTLTNCPASYAGTWYAEAYNIYDIFSPVYTTNWTLTVLVPPAITAQPLSQAVVTGSNATFTVAAGGTAPLTYQWSFNGTNISRGTNASLALTNLQTANAGNYAVVITNLAGSVTSVVATLTVSSKPLITSQPQNLSVPAGQLASFSVTAVGTAPLRYRWLFNGTNISGATNTSLSLANVQATNAGNYWVIVTNTAGSVTSSVAALTIIIAPAVTSQPASLSLVSGANATFSVGASGTAPLNYQWSLNGTNLSGDTNFSLTLTNIDPTDAGGYTVLVANPAGSATSSVAALNVLVPVAGSYFEAVVTNSPLAYWRLDELSGTTAFDCIGGNNATYYNVTVNQPGALATDSDPSAAFNGTTSYAGTGVGLLNNLPAFTLEGWYKLIAVTPRMGLFGQNDAIEFGFNTANTIHVYTGNGGLLTITNTWSKNSWHHVAAVGNGTNLFLYVDGNLAGTGGTATNNYGSSAYLFNIGGGGVLDPTANWFNGGLDEIAVYGHALAPADIKRHYLLGLALPTIALTAPASNAIYAAPAAINLAASVVTNGHAISQVQFFSGATLLGQDPAAPYTFSWTGVGAGTHSLSAVAVFDTGSVTSSVAPVTVMTPPSITTQPESQGVAQGQNVALSVTAGGSSPFTYQWYFNGSPLGGASSGSTYSLNNINTDKAGNYTVVVNNAVGSITSAVATVTVYVAPAIATQPKNQTVTLGQPAAFTVAANGSSPFGYQWCFNGAMISGATNTSLTLPAPQAADAGGYSVVVSNFVGSVTSQVATLTVNIPAYITAQPVSQSVIQGQAVAFTVGAGGTANVNYQWYFNGAQLGGDSKKSTITLAAVGTNDAGDYTVVVHNNYGAVTSAVAVLSILLPPAITNQPQSQALAIGQTADFSVGVTGASPLDYQWYFNGAILPGATNAIFTLTDIHATNAGSYTVVVTNLAGFATSAAAALTVTNPAITLSPAVGSGPSLTASGFAFQIAVPPGATYVILASPDLINWTPIATNVAASATEAFSDASATNSPSQYYRVMSW